MPLLAHTQGEQTVREAVAIFLENAETLIEQGGPMALVCVPPAITVPKIVPSACLVTFVSGKASKREPRINTGESHSMQAALNR